MCFLGTLDWFTDFLVQFKMFPGLASPCYFKWYNSHHSCEEFNTFSCIAGLYLLDELVRMISAFFLLFAVVFWSSIIDFPHWQTNICWSITGLCSYNILDMVLKYSSLLEHRLKVSSHLPAGIYKQCAALGIRRRPLYVHWGSPHNCFKRISAVSPESNFFPAIWSSSHRLIYVL